MMLGSQTSLKVLVHAGVPGPRLSDRQSGTAGQGDRHHPGRAPVARRGTPRVELHRVGRPHKRAGNPSPMRR